MKKHIPRGAPPLLIISLIIASMCYWGCQKPDDPTPNTPLTEEDKLPAATQEGKNTFGCLVDGKAWIPKSGGLLQPKIEPFYNELTGLFGISANRERIRYVIISCEGEIVKDTGTYSIPNNYLLLMDTTSVCPEYDNTSTYYSTIGHVNIMKLELISGIISGTFEFDAYSNECQDTIKVTQGRFDIKYK